MNDPIHLAKAFRSAKDSPNRCQLRRGFFLLALVLAWFTPSPVTEAMNPPPDGGYPNQNTAEGKGALFSLTIGGFDNQDNTAIGFDALFSSTNTFFNTAVGSQALFSSTSTEANTAVGYKAMFGNTTGSFNTATGQQALSGNNTGLGNTADGGSALGGNITGSYNTALGVGALIANTTGEDNIAIGSFAGFRLTTGNNNIDIGSHGVAGESGTIRLGSKTHKNTYIGGINGVTIAGGVGVVIDGKGHLGTSTSSAQYKEAIKPMDEASEAILALQPVTFRYKHELDPDGIPQFGLVAEQVEKVNPDLVARDDQGKPYTVRYEAVNAMLLNEFLKAHQKIEGLTRRNEQQESTNKELKSAIDQQRKEIQNLTAEVEMSKVAPQTVVNNR